MTIANKYGARVTWSELCQRRFASQAEARRGEELALLERAGEITQLAYQPRYVLSKQPRVTYTADFAYLDAAGEPHTEDVKGILTRDTRTRLCWLREKFPNAPVTLLRWAGREWEIIKWC